MTIKYIPIFADDPEKQVSFFTDYLGFELAGTKKVLQGQECTLIKTNNPDIFIIVIKDMMNEYRRCRIVLNSDDCLNDYHTLKMAGVVFCNEPYYLPMGLGAEFTDPAGNHYLLIEERCYNNLI